MKKFFNSTTVSVGLAIFSMLFGAGNLLYPLKVGMISGDKWLVGFVGFLLTAVCLPVIGLIAMILFDGNYDDFFGRLGKIPGKIAVFLCMLIIGPGLAMPRIITLSHTMMAPFLPIPILQTITPMASFIFSVIFLTLTFLGAFQKSKVVSFLGRYISPILLISLVIIIVKGILMAQAPCISTSSALTIFKDNFKTGYETLDLFGTIFFASIVLSAISRGICNAEEKTCKEKAVIGLKAGLLGASLLGIVYMGIAFLGAFHSGGIICANPGELFREVAINILTHYGAVIVSVAVFMACYSTAVALSAVVGTYLQKEAFKNKIDFVPALIIVLLACIPLSTAGLSSVLSLTAGPLTYIGLPMLIVLTLCNLAYKLFNFKPVKIPVLITFVTLLALYIYQYV